MACANFLNSIRRKNWMKGGLDGLITKPRSMADIVKKQGRPRAIHTDEALIGSISAAITMLEQIKCESLQCSFHVNYI